MGYNTTDEILSITLWNFDLFDIRVDFIIEQLC